MQPQKRMSLQTAISLLDEYNKKHGNPYTFIRYIEPDDNGAILECMTRHGENVSVGVYPDIVLPLPE